jgi:hypothetical protein
MDIMNRLGVRSMLLVFFILASLTCEICAQDSLVVNAPEVANPGESIIISGSGADPNETLVLSTSSSMSVDASPNFKIAVPGYCIISTDVMSIEAKPVANLIMGWQHIGDMEESWSCT